MPDVIAVGCDVSDDVAVNDLANAALSAFGPLDAWVDNAGITRDNRIAKMSLNDVELVIEVHLAGTWLGKKAAGALMREQGAGRSSTRPRCPARAGSWG